MDLDLASGEFITIVGPSGCGKSTLGRTLVRLYTPTEGNILFQGKNLSTLSPRALKPLRKDIQMIFQDPYASLNARMTVQDIIGEPIDIHRLAKNKVERTRNIEELLTLVGLHPGHKNRYPHEFSGGQRQRIGIARALAVKPKFIICDEPISALDVSIQAQIVNLLKNLQNQLHLTFLFIAHDLSMVEFISDRVAVMYLGHIVELASSDQLYKAPKHPYTQALLSAIPIPNPVVEKKRQRIHLQGEVPSPISPPIGCPFVKRCPQAHDRCVKERPKVRILSPEHQVACHLY